MMKNYDMYPSSSKELAEQKAALAMDNLKAWRKFSRTIFSEGALPEKTKQLIAVAVGHVSQCPYCIRAHTRQALEKGASEKEIMEAGWIATELLDAASCAPGDLTTA